MMNNTTRICTGDHVVIVSAGEFYAFVDGWQGRVVGWQGGHAEILCRRPDGDKTLWVPPDQLALTVGD